MEQVLHDKEIIAIIIRKKFRTDGVEFFTPGEFSQQLGYMNRPAGYVIPAHTHKQVHRDVLYTLETLFVRSGRVRIDFYTRNNAYLESRELSEGDVILLASGGHGFEMLEPTEMIEVKQGPYITDEYKVLLPGGQIPSDAQGG